MIHYNTTVRVADGRYIIEWTDGKPLERDQVLMSVELFEKAVDALNLGLTAQVLGPDDMLILGGRRLSDRETERIIQQLRDRGLAGRVLLVEDMDARIQPAAPGHTEAEAPCRATAPCPACRRVLDVEQTAERKANYGHLKFCAAVVRVGTSTQCDCDAAGWAARRAVASQAAREQAEQIAAAYEPKDGSR